MSMSERLCGNGYETAAQRCQISFLHGMVAEHSMQICVQQRGNVRTPTTPMYVSGKRKGER
jgi:hypothetical protein